jgi:hypothetical protein
VSTYSVLPANLTLRCFVGDEFNALLDFDIDLTGYAISTEIYRLGDPVLTNGQLIAPKISEGSFSVTVLSYPLGQIRLSLDETQTAAKSGLYRFAVRWIAPGDVTRTVLNGTLDVVGDLTSASGTNTDGDTILVTVGDTVSTGALPVAVGAALLLGELVWG